MVGEVVNNAVIPGHNGPLYQSSEQAEGVSRQPDGNTKEGDISNMARRWERKKTDNGPLVTSEAQVTR